VDDFQCCHVKRPRSQSKYNSRLAYSGERAVFYVVITDHVQAHLDKMKKKKKSLYVQLYVCMLYAQQVYCEGAHPVTGSRGGYRNLRKMEGVSPLLFPPFPYPFSFPSSPSALELGPLNQLGSMGERCKLPEVKASAETTLMHSNAVRQPLMAII